MKKILFIFVALAFIAVSCSRSERYRKILADAERTVAVNPDSAMSMINVIEVSDLRPDSLRAQYYLVKASAHKANESSMASDSLVRFSFEYYRNPDRSTAGGR